MDAKMTRNLHTRIDSSSLIWVTIVFSLVGLTFTDRSHAAEADITAKELVEAAIDQTRGISSYAEFSMVIHRPDWERTSSLKSWTRGRKDALIRFIAPAKDAGNATLKLGNKMWTFTPKLNRTIRLPYSLMSQSWGGSDFSYTDLSRSDNWLNEYDLSIASVTTEDDHKIYTLVAIPHDNAPVVWGKEEMLIRDDYVMLQHTFYDQSMEPLKTLETLEIGERDGRMMATRMRMVKLNAPEKYTELIWGEADFDVELEDQMFTLFYLKSGE
ncbi:MAG: outer membrane lipoprotein-sorting protein [Gammaproteobacteria bacterium]|jgi:outer membrane lipoprotein-sorting protein|nr:outer membrane lipoprotein-sorting protein [Gammaproteobacteria bacterium]|tara:strand:- start:4541 stop:5350 length:810 start_codon:yes stop_codon:yes gene_type:complete